MAMVRLLNQATTVGGNAVPWYISHVLCYLGGSGAGWSVAMSGSGIGGVYSATGDVFDRTGINPVSYTDVTDIGVGVGDEHFGGRNCWFVLEDPNGRQWMYQRTSTAGTNYDDDWAIWISPSGSFTGGDEDTRATATDEYPLWAYTTGAFSTIFQVGGSNNLIHIVADDTADAVSGEYGFWMVEITPSITLSSVIMQDPLQGFVTGDPAPVTFSVVDTSLFTDGYYDTNTYPPSYISEQGLAGEVKKWVRYAAIGSGTLIYPFNSQESVYDSKARGMPCPVFEGTGGSYLGWSRWLNWAPVNRNYPDTSDSKNYLCLNDFLISGWDGSTTPLTA